MVVAVVAAMKVVVVEVVMVEVATMVVLAGWLMCDF